jgi:hypothetical protein
VCGYTGTLRAHSVRPPGPDPGPASSQQMEHVSRSARHAAPPPAAGPPPAASQGRTPLPFQV